MTPAARMQAAIDVLDDWAPGRQADRLLLAWGRANRYAGSKDRAAVADHVYDALRRWRSLAWPDVAGGGRARLLSLAAEAEALAGWTGERHAPAPPGEAEMAALQADLDAAPEGVRLDLPDWLLPEWRASLGDTAASVAVSLAQRAPLDLRTTMTRATPEAAIARLAEDGVAAEPGPLSPACLRVTDGARALRRAGRTGARLLRRRRRQGLGARRCGGDRRRA